MSTFIHSLRGQMSTPLYELGGKCPHMQFLGRGQMCEGANVRLPFKCYKERKVQSSYEPRSEKTGLRGFRPGPTQTGLYSHRRWLEA